MNEQTKTEKPVWLFVAEAERGVAEQRNGDNPKIVEYHRSTLLNAKNDETPWCSSFVNWVFMKSGLERTKSAAARSWLNYGVSLEKPRLGAVVVISRGNSLWQGHVGFYYGQKDKENFFMLGGNQADKVSVQIFPNAKILGFRWPILPEVEQVNQKTKEKKNGK
jgi:uncharacterized protein (TIGR02594 family)